MLADEATQPTLTEMVQKAVEILKKNENGFVLLVEGGRIDTAHHDTLAQLALEEANEFQKAVECAKNNTNEEDTLIVVTSDHSTSMTVSGYMVEISSLLPSEVLHAFLLFLAPRIQHSRPGRLLKIG